MSDDGERLPAERRRSVGDRRFIPIFADIEAMKKEIATLKGGHAAIQTALKVNTDLTAEIKRDTAQLVGLVKGTQTGIRWGGSFARWGFRTAKWVAAIAAAAAVIKYGFLDVLHWIKNL